MAAALQGDMAYFEREGEHAIAELVYLTHAGMTVDEFHELAAKFFETAKHPKYGVLLKEATYQPMANYSPCCKTTDLKHTFAPGAASNS